MEIGETIYVTTSDEFRAWLIKNHQTKKEIWLIQYKKATKKPSINYVAAVEEAICFGWIDGFEKGENAHLKLEYYDFSESAHEMFGNDISYFGVEHWLKEN